MHSVEPKERILSPILRHSSPGDVVGNQRGEGGLRCPDQVVSLAEEEDVGNLNPAHRPWTMFFWNKYVSVDDYHFILNSFLGHVHLAAYPSALSADAIQSGISIGGSVDNAWRVTVPVSYLLNHLDGIVIKAFVDGWVLETSWVFMPKMYTDTDSIRDGVWCFEDIGDMRLHIVGEPKYRFGDETVAGEPSQVIRPITEECVRSGLNEFAEIGVVPLIEVQVGGIEESIKGDESIVQSTVIARRSVAVFDMLGKRTAGGL